MKGDLTGYVLSAGRASLFFERSTKTGATFLEFECGYPRLYSVAFLLESHLSPDFADRQSVGRVIDEPAIR